MAIQQKPYYALGLIGYPLGHSFSPRLHQAALRALGLPGEYELFAIPPTEEGKNEIRQRLTELRNGKLQGLNVTIPHKQTVIPFVDELSDVARAVGAVNTLFVNADQRLVGDNTDVPGFLHDLHRLTPLPGGSAVVLGAGGSARAVVFALAQMGWMVKVFARRIAQAEDLIQAVTGGVPAGLTVKALRLERTTLEGCLTNCDLVVNTTPVGMYPHGDECPWPADLLLPEHAAVYDLIYNPLETVLVRRARAAGLPAANGAGMLAAQAALSFQKWTGLAAPFEVMEQAFYTPQNMEKP